MVGNYWFHYHLIRRTRSSKGQWHAGGHGKTDLPPSRSILQALTYFPHTYMLNTEEILGA